METVRNDDDLIHDPYFDFTDASTGQRFGNFLIDNLLMNYGLGYLTGTAIGTILAEVAPAFLYDISATEFSWELITLSWIIGIFNYLVYYNVCEKLFKGYTLGKLITGTRAIRNDGGELTVRDALLRTLVRLVPFEAFSGFGTPWHDKWTGTRVVKAR